MVHKEQGSRVHRSRYLFDVGTLLATITDFNTQAPFFKIRPDDLNFFEKLKGLVY